MPEVQGADFKYKPIKHDHAGFFRKASLLLKKSLDRRLEAV
jgi:hypothetical protein